MLGQKVGGYTFDGQSQSVTIDITHLSAGTYMLRIHAQDAIRGEQIFIRKVTKK